MLTLPSSGNTITDIYSFRDENGRTYSGYDLGGESSAVSPYTPCAFIRSFACAH